MNIYDQKKYMLVIKRDNKDYLHLEWNKTKYYNGENLNTLEGIDKFTSTLSAYELIDDVISKSLVSDSEKYRSFAIIFNEKGKTRELKEGVVFAGLSDVLIPDNIITFLTVNIDNKEFINTVTTLIKGKDQHSEEFKYILKNIDIFVKKGPKAVKVALDKFKELPYEERRSLSIQLNNRYIER